MKQKIEEVIISMALDVEHKQGKTFVSKFKSTKNEKMKTLKNYNNNSNKRSCLNCNKNPKENNIRILTIILLEYLKCISGCKMQTYSYVFEIIIYYYQC